MLSSLPLIRNAKAGRFSSWAVDGRNGDRWTIEPGEAKVLAEIEGPGAITHIWMTQRDHYRECLLRFTWDDATSPSIVVPLGDFFCLGNGLVNTFDSLFFSASTNASFHGKPSRGCALNCYLLMPFRKRAKIELLNESSEPHGQYFYIDYETYAEELPSNAGYLHAEFRRTNPFGGWGPEIKVNTGQFSNIVNKEQGAWDNNYVILETKGRGHYIGCNMSVANFQATWWGEGDDMIWVDGYKWPPDLHGTGSEDYFGQAWGMQPNAFAHNGTSIHESISDGYQTSYVWHMENPVHFQKEIKVTMEVGHGNHLRNDVSTVAYWYADTPSAACAVPPVQQRLAVMRDPHTHRWIADPAKRTPSREIPLNDEMREKKEAWEQFRLLDWRNDVPRVY